MSDNSAMAPEALLRHATLLKLAAAVLVLAWFLTSEWACYVSRSLPLRALFAAPVQGTAATRRPPAAAAAAHTSPSPNPSETSTSLAGNVPLAVVAVLTLRWAFVQLEAAQRARARVREAQRWRRELREEPPTTPGAAATGFGLPPGAAKPDAWRKFVRSPVVEDAWTRFCGSIIQEVRCTKEAWVGG